MSEYTLNSAKIKEFRNSSNRVQVLYEWVQDNKITVDQFRTLLDENTKEQQRQINLDTFD